MPRGVLPGAPLVPGEAVLRTGGGGAQLVVVSPGSEATRRDVSRGERVIVASGLPPGEVLAIRRQHRMPEGMTVPASTRTDGVLPSDPHY
ncbi:hypothetical protein [Pararhodobacter aggregans]|uniref:hypothetical protein n=1 Tax=Pararhodobacter aggregans TaxID=404875 RepID=UPI0014757E26|nr:hypothetical protein [Pararhodobacter aggregans]